MSGKVNPRPLNLGVSATSRAPVGPQARSARAPAGPIDQQNLPPGAPYLTPVTLRAGYTPAKPGNKQTDTPKKAPTPAPKRFPYVDSGAKIRAKVRNPSPMKWPSALFGYGSIPNLSAHPILVTLTAALRLLSLKADPARILPGSDTECLNLARIYRYE